MSRVRDVGLRFAAALTCSLLSASLMTSCTKGTKSASSVRASAENWKATPEAVKNTYPPNQTILDPIKFVVTTKEGSPVPNINVEFKAFDVTPAFNGGVSTEAMKAEILTKWSDGNYVMNSSGSIAGNTCDAGFTRDVCVGQLSGPSKVTNQNGEATVGFTTPNAPGGVMAIAMRVPQDSTASELIEMVLIKITSNDDFANSGIEPLQSAFIVIPLLFDDDGRQVIQAGVPFNLAIYAPGIPNTAPGKGFMFDFVTEGLGETADGSTVVVPTGSKRCEFRNSQCIVPGGPFRVLKPTTLSFSARPSDPKFPVRPASFSIPVISGRASQLIVALSPDTKNIQNACIDGVSSTKPCLVLSADTEVKELYPMLVDAGGNWVESPDTVWDVSGPLVDDSGSFITEVKNGKQELRPKTATPSNKTYDEIRVSVKGKPIYTILKYVVNPGAPSRIRFTNSTQTATVPFPAVMELSDKNGNKCYNFSGSVGMTINLSPLSEPTPVIGLDTATIQKVPTQVRTGDNGTSKVTFTNGQGTTQVVGSNEGFVITKQPPINDSSQWPKLSVLDNRLTLPSGSVILSRVDAESIRVEAGPVTQTLWREAPNGEGPVWVAKSDIDPVKGVTMAADQQYNFYLAGYDAAGNFKEDFRDVNYWGVKYTLDDRDPTPEAVLAFNSAIEKLFDVDPAKYGSGESCPRPPKIPYAGRPRTDLCETPGDTTCQAQVEENNSYISSPDLLPPNSQPEDNNVFCGTHLSLSNRGGSSFVFFSSRGMGGTGRLLAVPKNMFQKVSAGSLISGKKYRISKVGTTDFTNIGAAANTEGTTFIASGAGTGDGVAIDLEMKVKPALTPRLSVVAGAATAFAFEFISAEPGSLGVIKVNKNSDQAMPTGHRFKMRIYAQDAQKTDAPTYLGKKTLQVRFIGDKSWTGVLPTLPNGDFECDFGNPIPAGCELPGTYMLTDSRSSATIAVKQTTAGGVQGTFAKIMSTTPGDERRIVFANIKGGPAAGAVPDNSFQLPMGRKINVDGEVPLGVAVTDAGGSYIRDVRVDDGMFYEGFSSEDGAYRLSTQAVTDPDIFNPATGDWTSANWFESYTTSDVFVASNINSFDVTPVKFYAPNDTSNPPQVLQANSKDTTKYSIVFVPQNRFGSGFAVPRSATNPNLVGWPSSWWTVSPGNPEHIEVVLDRVSPQTPRPAWSKGGVSASSLPDEATKNWVETSERCYDVAISIHDKKHNLLTEFTGQVPGASLKLINVTAAAPNGVADLKAGTFAQELSGNPDLRDYYMSHNESLVKGPFRDGFFIPGTSHINGGDLIFNSSGKFIDLADQARQDWWRGAINISNGKVSTGVKVCLFNGQTPESRAFAAPFAEKYLQLDLPDFTRQTAQRTFFFPAFQSRGAGVRFISQNGQIGSLATPHIHKDVMTVFRSAADHLHPTFTDNINSAADNGKDKTFRPINGDSTTEVPVVGVTPKCPAPSCAGALVYWHEHDVTHNYIGPASLTGFQTGSSMAGADSLGPQGPLGSPSTLLFGPSSTQREINTAQTSGQFKIYARNANANSYDLGASADPRYRYGANIKFIPGPPASMKVTRTGSSTISVGDAFGVNLDLFDAYGNPTGGQIYAAIPGDLNSNFNVPRTLSLWYDSQPSDGPISGQPRIHDRVGAGLADPGNPVNVTITPNPNLMTQPTFQYQMNLANEATSLRLVRANESLKLNVKLTDNQVVNWCKTAGNCNSTGALTFNGVVSPIVAVPNITSSIVLTEGTGADAVLYPLAGDPNADQLYAALFNKNPSLGVTYPLGVNISRTFRTSSCGRDMFGNITSCDALNDFEIVDATNPSPPNILSNNMLGQKFFEWRATKPGTFAIKATSGTLTATTAPIQVAARPLENFGFTNTTQLSDISAGSEFDFKVCLQDEAKNVITTVVRNGTGQVVTDPDAEITVGIGLLGMTANSEGKSLEVSTGKGADFEAKKLSLTAAKIKFTQGCANLTARLYAANPAYNNRSLLSISYVDPMQGDKTFSGSGLTVRSVTPLEFDHFATAISKAPVLTGNAVVPAYADVDAPANIADRGENVTADVPEAGSVPQGNRFDLTVYPRDIHGNDIVYSSNAVVRLQPQGSTTPSSFQLICASPTKGTACLNQPLNGSSLTIANLAIDVPGSYFVFAETTTGTGKSLTTSAGLLAQASLRTIKEFSVSSPDSHAATVATGVPLTVRALDNRGNAIPGISGDLNDSSKINFTWIDFDGSAMSSQLPPFGQAANANYSASCKPTLPRPVFDNSGVATFGNNSPQMLFVTKTRTDDGTADFSVKINLTGQLSGTSTSIRSSNTKSTVVTRDGTFYDVSCSLVSGGGDCSGTESDPFVLNGSPETRFNVTVKSYDRCGNNVPTASFTGRVTLSGGVPSNFYNTYAPETLGDPNIRYSGSSGLDLNMGGLNQRTFQDLYVRAVGVATYSIYDIFGQGVTNKKVYHRYTPTLATVANYNIQDVSAAEVKAGETITFKLAAVDMAGAPVAGIETLLNQQNFTWFGGSVAPNNAAPTYPTGQNPSRLTFTSTGVTGTLSVTFRKAEQIADFFVMDDFVKGSSGVLGRGIPGVTADPTGRRRSYSQYLPLALKINEALPKKFVMTPVTSNVVKAGSAFDVKVAVVDSFDNPVTTFGAETLTFSWLGASSSVPNPVNGTAISPGVLPSGSRQFLVSDASFTSTGNSFVLYRYKDTSVSSPEKPTLKVVGSRTGATMTATGVPLEATLDFTVEAADAVSYVKIADGPAFSAATNFSGKTHTMTNDQTKSFFAFVFDQWGNFKGSDQSVRWSGTNVLANRLLPPQNLNTVLTPTLAGSGVVKASCTDINPTCVEDSTSTITVNPSPLVSFGIDHISPLEGSIVNAGQEISFKVCMLDKNKQVITQPVIVNGVTITQPTGSVSDIGLAQTLYAKETDEKNSIDISTGTGNAFDANRLVIGRNTLTFDQGCVNLYAKVYAAGAYEADKNLISLSYSDPKQNSLAVGGVGLRVSNVNVGAFDHYVTWVGDAKIENFKPIVPAWADPTTANVLASNNGNRFSVTVQSRDKFGNPVAVSKPVTLRLMRVVNNVDEILAPERLKCQAPDNDQSCLSVSLTNASSVSRANLAVDIAGEFFINATDGDKSIVKMHSSLLTATASTRTVKNYALTTVPSTIAAGVQTPIRVEARDAAGQPVSGADTGLRGLTFDWLNGSSQLISQTQISPAPKSEVPILASSFDFNAGVATPQIMLTRATAVGQPLTLNVRDSQSTAVSSNNSTTTTVTPGSTLRYAITCTKVISGVTSDCSGTSTSAASINASPADAFNLQLKAFDQYDNPKSDGANNPAIRLSLESGTATIPGFVEQLLPSNASFDVNKQVLVPMTGVSQASIQNLFHRAGPHVISYSVDPSTATYTEMQQRTFHSYQAHIDMVYRYDFSPDLDTWPNPPISGTTSMVAGTPQAFTLQAKDRAGNIARDIDTQLSAQKFLWKGPTKAPDLRDPVLPGPMTGAGESLTFNQGQVTGLSATFRNAETIADFHVIDNYSPGSSGIGGLGDGGKRRTNARDGANPLRVINARPTEYVLSTASTSVKAGAGFNVTVSVVDEFKNPAKTWTQDTLNFTWQNASPSSTSPSNSPVFPGTIAPILRNFDPATATFISTGNGFAVYKAPETPTLKVTGTTIPSGASSPLVGTLQFTAQPSTINGAVKIASSGTVYDDTTKLSGVGLNMATNDTKTFFAHMLDPWGNYLGVGPSVNWTGTDQINGKLNPVNAASTVLTANVVGSGVLTANCSGLDTGCLSDSTGTITVGASPLKDFVVEHVGTPAVGETVAAGTEIPMRVCMLDKAGQRITTNVSVDGVLKTVASETLDVTIYPTGVANTSENKSIELSRQGGANFDSNKLLLNTSTTLDFNQGCAPFWAKLYAASSYPPSTTRVQISHNPSRQPGVTVTGSGLSLAGVTGLGLHHFAVTPEKTDTVPQPISIYAQAVPDNIYAQSKGSRFDLKIDARDLYGNPVTLTSQTVNISTLESNKITPRTRPLVCPAANPSCLSPSMTGSTMTVQNLAIDVGGFSFWPVVKSGTFDTDLSLQSQPIHAASSKKTVKEYAVSYPTTTPAGSPITVSVTAKDVTGATVLGSDGELSDLNFSWYDGQATRQLLSTHTAPDTTPPSNVNAAKMTFSSGSASRSITLTKAETNLKINVQDDQTTPVVSNAAGTIDVGVGVPTWWDLTCLRTSNGQPCNGSLASPSPFVGVEKFSLTLKSFDQYKNPKPIIANPEIELTRNSGAGGIADIEQFPVINNRSAVAKLLIVSMNGSSNTATVEGLFRRSATQEVSMAVRPASAPYTGMYTSVYHRNTPTIDSVYRYILSANPALTSPIVAGSSILTRIMAVDAGSNPVDNIATALNAQNYFWSGVTAAPNGTQPVLPGVSAGPNGNGEYAAALTFDNTGQTTTSQNMVFYKAETLRSSEFMVRDSYNGTDGLGGISNPFRHSVNVSLVVQNAAPSRYDLTASSATPQAGTAFNVKVTAVDQYLNRASTTSWPSDNLTFTWSNAGSSWPNPVNLNAIPASAPSSAINATFASGVFDTTGNAFRLYESNFLAAGPQKVSTLTVTGSTTTGTANNQVLSHSMQFTVQPATAISYVKIANAEAFSEQANLSSKPLSFDNNQSLTLYSHAFDAFGNWKGRTNVQWSGDGQLAGRVTPVSPAVGSTAQVTPVEAGSGKIYANCSTQITNCVNDQTGDIGVVSTPLASFTIEHQSPVASGSTVDVGQEIPLKICMRDSKNQIITQTVVDQNNNVITNPNNQNVSLTFQSVRISSTDEQFSAMNFSTGSGTTNYALGQFSLGSKSLPFNAGCTTIYAKVYKAGDYNAADDQLSISYTDTVQNKNITGSGLKILKATPGSLHHFVTTASGLANTPDGNSTEAWSSPGSTNIPANTVGGGNRFNVSVLARDEYGNAAFPTANTPVTLALVKSNGSTAAERELICSATGSPANGTGCLSASIPANSDRVTVNNLAVDIGGQNFYVRATGSGVPFIASYSTRINAVANRKTVKEYVVVAPSAAQAGIGTSVTVRAVDNSNSTIIGADSDLNNNVFFDWIDGDSSVTNPNLLSSHVALDGATPALSTPPVLPGLGASSATQAGKFSAGSATVNLTFVLRESGLKINVRDNQASAVRSNNTSGTDVSSGVTLTYQITCTKETAGAIGNGQDCSGSLASPASISASASDRFRLLIKPFDQYKNPKAGNANDVLSTVLHDGTAGGALVGFVEQAPALLQTSGNNPIVDTTNPDGVTVTGLFHRAGNHVVTYSMTGSTNDSGRWGRTYHNFTPSIDMVHRYEISTVNNHTAGVAQNVTMTAYDRASNIAKGGTVDADLRAQTYQWFGPTGQAIFPKTGSNPTAANQITFTNGVSESLNFTFNRAESVNFSLQDNYSPVNVGGVNIGGTGSGAKRVSNTRSFTVGNALANSFAITPSTTNPMAGSAFGVRVTALDQFGNRAFGYNDNLTISWQNAATVGPDAANAKNPTSTFTPSTMGAVTLTNGQYDSGSTGLMLYRSGQNPLLRVQGSSTSNQLAQTISQDYTFATAVVPNTNHGFVKVTSALDYNPATELSGPRDITTDQTATLYAHMFDDFGNWKGNSFSVVWSGSGQLQNKLTTPGFASTLAPNVQGSGQVTATCSGLTTGCVAYTTGLYTVNPGLVSKFVWLSPTPATISQTTENCVEYRLQVQDQQNNPVNVSADYGITFRAVKAGVTDTSGDFFTSLEQCQTAQAVADAAALNTAAFHSSSTLSGSAGNRVANITQGSNAVSVWYANRTTTSTGAASLTATSGTVSNSRAGEINAGPTKRFAITSSAMTVNAAGTGSVAPNCGAVTYKFQDKWQNDTPTTAASTINVSSSSPNATGRFYSDNTCQTQIASGSRTVNSGAANDTVWYNDTQANSPTLTLASTSTLSGNTVLAAQTIGATVNPGTFSVSTPTSGSAVKDINGSTGPQFSWGASLGARDYTVTYGSTSTCGTTLTAATTATSANLPFNQNGTFFICVRANGYTGAAPGTPQINASTNATYQLVVDNVASTAVISVPASSVTYIGPVTPATHTATVNTSTTTVFAGTASDATSGVNRVDITLQRTSNSQYWTGSGWSTTETWLQATGTTSWKYEIADGSFVDGAAYTLRARVTDGSLNQSSPVSKAFTWKSTATDARISSGAPAANAYSKLATLASPGVVIDDNNAPNLVTHYTYAIVSGATCPATIGGYSSTFNPVATKITDNLSATDGQYTLCVLGRDEAGNVQAVGSPTSRSWTKDTANPTITAMSQVTVNSAHAAAPNVSDNIDAVANMTYAWSYVSSPDGRCTGASFTAATAKDTSISATGCSTPSVPNTNWGTVTVRLTVTDRASNSSTSDLNIRWDQQAPYVASITSSVAANSNCRVGFCGATAQANIPISIVFTKDAGNFNRNSFNLAVSGTPSINLNIRGTSNVTRTAALTPNTYNNNGSGTVTVAASYSITAGDASGTASGVVLNADSATPFNNISSVVDNTGTTGTAASNAGVPTTGTSALSNLNIKIDTVAPTATAALANAAVGGYINDGEKNLTTALVDAAVGAETLSSTDVPQYKVIPLATTCDSAVTGMTTTIPTPSSAGMASLTEGTYRVCMRIVDLAGNVGYSVSNNIVVDRTFPVFTSINVPVTGINNTNSSSTNDIGNTLSSSSADAASNPITYSVTKNTTCDANITYGAMPKINAMDSDGTWYLCVRLEDIAGNIAYGQAASSINRQTVAAQLVSTSFRWTGDAANYFLNINEQSGTGDVLTAATANKTGVTFRYQITSTPATDCSALTYSSSALPAKTAFTPGGTYKACVQMTDAVGNLSYAATSDSNNLVVDLTAPTLTFSLANRANDNFINAGERSDTNVMATESSPSADIVSSTKRYKVIDFATACGLASVGTSTQTAIPASNSTDFSSDGDYKICLMVEDTAGNVGYVASGKITLDTVAPTLGTYALANDAVGGYINDTEKNNTSAVVSYSGGTGTSTSYQLTQTATTDTGATGCSDLTAASYSSTAPGSSSLGAAGTYRVCLRIGDTALNYTYKISADIIKDISAPTRSTGFDWTNGAVDGYISATDKTNALGIISAITTSDGSVDYAFGTAATCAAMTGYSSTLITMASVGIDNTAYRACARMTDLAGNVGYYTPTTTLNVDTAAPTFSFTTTQPVNRSNSTSLNIQATSTTSSTLVTNKTDTDTRNYYYKVISGATSDCSSVGTWSSAITYSTATTVNISSNAAFPTGYPEGNVTICARAEDGAGNQSSVVAQQWIKDVTPPDVLTITAPAQNALQNTMTPTISWSTPAWVTGGSPADAHTIELYVATDSTCTVGNRKYSNSSIVGVASTTQSQAIPAGSITVDGTYYICMYVADAATNKTALISRTFEVETDTLHFSYTDSGGVKYARYSSLTWSTGEVVANAASTSYDARTSLQLDDSGNPYVSFKAFDGTNTSMRYIYRSGGSWINESSIQSNTTSTDVGLFNDISVDTDGNVVAAFLGQSGNSTTYGQYLSTALGVIRPVSGSTGQFTDVAITQSASFTYSLTAQSGALKIYASGSAKTIPTTNLPTNCSVQKVSAVAKSGSVLAVALGCAVTGGSCSAFYGDISYDSASNSFSAPTSANWVNLGTIKAASCTSLSNADRPSIMVDRQTGTKDKVAIAWVNQDSSALNYWSNESGSNTNQPVLTGTTIGWPSIGFDKSGKAYIVYRDANEIRVTTNNKRIGFTNTWTTTPVVTSGGVTGIGNIGITGMKGRGNTNSGQ